MDQLLIVASPTAVAQSMLQALRLAGWKISIAEDIASAQRLLEKGTFSTVMVDLPRNSTQDRLRILRFVHESCPSAKVILVQSPIHTVTEVPISNFNQSSDGKMLRHAETGEHLAILERCHLTPTQKRIAELVAQAYPNREIARKLKIKEQSVRNHLTQVFKKLGIVNRLELAVLLPKTESLVSPSLEPPLSEKFTSAPADIQKDQELMTI